MAQPRIRGQEVTVTFIGDGVPRDVINAVRSFEIAAQMEILRESYLGETTDRRDDIYRGVRGRIEFHTENQDVLVLTRFIVDRARRRRPGDRINVKATLAYPNGDRPIIVLPDVFFGEVPITFPSRSDYVTAAYEFEADDFRVVTS